MHSKIAKERPILFSGAMVRAILEGRKTQTRRVLDRMTGFKVNGFEASTTPGYAYHFRCQRGLWQDMRYSEVMERCPYGTVGDRLWVRETVYIDDYRLLNVAPSKWPTDVEQDAIYYRADGECCEQIPECMCATEGKPNWTPSIHMPRWVSRITLEITGVRVERLNEISEADAIAEGVESQLSGSDIVFRNYKKGQQGWTQVARCSFEWLWESINGPGSWAANPWVWVVEFKTITR